MTVIVVILVVLGLGGVYGSAHLMFWDEKRRSKLTPEKRLEEEQLDDEMKRW